MSFFSFFQRKSPISGLDQYDLSPNEINSLRQFVQLAGDHELFRVNPRYLAEKLDWREERTLDVLTMLVAEKLWGLEWEAYCPACGNLLQRTEEFSELESHHQCENCYEESEIRLDEEITPRASIRENTRRLRPHRRDDPDFRTNVDDELGRLPALQLINRNLFREMLGTQVLPPDHSLGVQHLAVFLSDLKGSTAMYQKLGDAAAYQLVREHFDVIFSAVERHGGSAVKTIGDGVMGTFFDNASALRGVVESVRGVSELNQQAGLSEDDRLRLKVGLHAGQCIVVTLNGRLDYFGSTVNIAARLSDLAQGDDIWLSKSVLEDPVARQIADELRCDREEMVSLRGIGEEVDVCRVRLKV